MDLPINENCTTGVAACPRCGGANSAEDGGNTGCFHCECGWIECGDADIRRDAELENRA